MNVWRKFVRLFSDINNELLLIVFVLKERQKPLLALASSGSAPSRQLRDRTRNPYNRHHNYDDDNDYEDDEIDDYSDEEEMPETPEEEISEVQSEDNKDVSTESPEKPKDSKLQSLKKRILRNPWTYFTAGTVLFIGFIIGIIISIFPPKFQSEVPKVMCAGPSVLDNLKVITRGPTILDMNGDFVSEGVWMDTWEFYDYAIAVVNNEVATGLISLSNQLNGKNSEIMVNEEYYRTIDFAYYQAQALASISYALNPDVGNYLNEDLKKANVKKYFEMCPLIHEDPNYTIEEMKQGVRRRPNGFMLCNDNWGKDIEIIVAANGVGHQTACSIKRGCYHYGMNKTEESLTCEVEEVDGVYKTTSSDPRCFYTSPVTNQSNANKKIFLRSDCMSNYKTNDGNFSNVPMEFTCPNTYCKKFPSDPDCASAPNDRIPKRAYLNIYPKITNSGVDVIDREKYPAEAEAWDKREKYLNDVIDSVRGVVLTDINGVPGRADFKGNGDYNDIEECKNEINKKYPKFINDMCHARDTAGEFINGFYQSTVLRWPVHKIVSYWYDFYFSSWSESGRSECQLVDVDLEKELEIFNYDAETKSLKFPDEQNFGELLMKYEEIRLSKVQEETDDDSGEEMTPELEEYLKKDKNQKAEAEFKKINKYIFDNSLAFGKIGTGKSVAGAAVALSQYVQIYGAKMPYTLGGNYYNYGANPKWGTLDDNGMPLGMDCIGFTNWSIMNGGIKPNFSRHGDLANVDLNRGDIPYVWDYDNVSLLASSKDIAGLSSQSYLGNAGNNFARRVNMGNFGDIIFHAKGSDQYAHAKIIVGYAFNTRGVIVGNVVAEAKNPDNGIMLSVVSVRTGKKMHKIERNLVVYAPDSDYIYSDVGVLKEVTEEQIPQKIIYEGTISEYADFCFRDPNLSLDYDAYGINTAYCHEFSSEPYVVIDYSSCYEDRRGFQDEKICEKEDLEVYSKAILSIMEEKK